MISVNGVSKCYRMYRRPYHQLFEWFDPLRRSFHWELWAVRNVSFQVADGEAFGVVGWNGSGKSTLLRIVCGITAPTSGAVEVRGEVGALLSAAVGFNTDLSGKRNLLLNAPLLGVDPGKVEKNIQEIADLSGIGEMINYPVRTYSTGMRSRLSFALASQVSAPVLVVDEVLTGGDRAFKARAAERLNRYKERGKAILLASHKMEVIRAVCGRALWLHEGEVKAIGPSNEVLKQYEEFSDFHAPRGAGTPLGMLKDYLKFRKTRRLIEDVADEAPPEDR